jgi:hypothetical protein
VIWVTLDGRRFGHIRPQAMGWAIGSGFAGAKYGDFV